MGANKERGTKRSPCWQKKSEQKQRVVEIEKWMS